MEVLKIVQEDVIRLLAERKIDTSVFSASYDSNEANIKENAQNVRNRQCQITYTAQIERFVFTFFSTQCVFLTVFCFELGQKQKPSCGQKQIVFTIPIWLNWSNWANPM